MPQGGIGEGEPPREAALRELLEETGVRSVETIGEVDEWLYYDLPVHLRGASLGRAVLRSKTKMVCSPVYRRGRRNRYSPFQRWLCARVC